MSVIINIHDKRWEQYKIDFVKVGASALKDKGAEVSITLTNDVEIKKLNKRYRGKDKPTNVLSFETEDKELLGDVFISFDAVMREKPDNFINHAAHLVVHGVLHLQGMDHIEDKDAEIMENREMEILRGFKMTKNMNIFSIFGLLLLGAIGVFGFAPFYFWPLTIISIATAYYCMTWAPRSSRGMTIGFWWGAGYGIASFRWALESIFANEEIAREIWWLYPFGLIGIAIGSGIIFGLPFWMTARTKSEGWRRALYFALAWAFVLWLREWFLTGFPWNPIANITLPSLHLSGLMIYAGALGLTFVLIGAIASIPEYLRTRVKWQFLFFAPLFAAFLLPAPPTELTDTFVRIVQPSFDMNQKFDRESAEENIRVLMKLSQLPSERPLEMVIWPETAFPYAIDSRIRMPALGVPLVAGVVYFEVGKPYNAMIMTNAEGEVIDKYFKFHLVPFGEYRPFGDIIPTPGQLSAGPGPRIMGNFAPAICYEIVFSDSLINRGEYPEFILNITNDAWFGTSIGPHQHLDMARRQAIETGLPIVRANHSGISAFIDARGRVLQSLPLEEQGVLDGYVPAAHSVTVYRRIGLNGTMLMIILASGLILLLSKKRKTL